MVLRNVFDWDITKRALYLQMKTSAFAIYIFSAAASKSAIWSVVFFSFEKLMFSKHTKARENSAIVDFSDEKMHTGIQLLWRLLSKENNYKGQKINKNVVISKQPIVA